MIPELLQTFQITYPDVQLMLYADVSCATTAAQEPGVDLAGSINEPIEEPQLLVQKLPREGILAIVAAKHPLTKQRKITAVEFADRQILLKERVCSYRTLLDQTLARAGDRIDRQVEFASVEGLKQCSTARMSVPILPELIVAAELRRGELVALSWPQKQIYVYTRLVRQTDKWFFAVYASLLEDGNTTRS